MANASHTIAVQNMAPVCFGKGACFFHTSQYVFEDGRNTVFVGGSGLGLGECILRHVRLLDAEPSPGWNSSES